MHFVSLALKNVLRRPIRSALTALGVALAVGTFVALVGISDDFVDSIRARYATQGIDLIVLKSGRTEQLYATLPERVGNQIQAVPNVKALSPILFDAVTFEGTDLLGVLIEGWYAESPLFDHVKILNGRRFATGDRNVVMLGKLLAQSLGKSVDDDIVIDGHAFHVIGEYEVENAFENGGALVLISDLQELMDRQGQVTGFEVLLQDNSDAAIAETCRQIADLHDERGRHWSLTATPANQQAAGFVFIKLGRAMAWVTSLIAIAIGAVGVLNTMMMSVFERTHEIGVLRAIGWRKRRIVRMIMLEALVVSVVGAAIGTIAAVLLARLFTLNPTFRAIVDGSIAPATAVEGVVVACLVAALGSIYPAWRAAHQSPVVALRHV
ncbi:MAG: FtsX-like permease family protein [Pirellulales bacterium]